MGDLLTLRRGEQAYCSMRVNMRIWRWTIMRTADYDAMLKGWDARILEDSNDQLLLRQENHVLSESLDRCKGANAAIIEQREELARQLRERKR